MVRGPITPTRVRAFLQEEWARAFRHDHWNIGIADAPIQRFLEPGAAPAVHWLPPPEPGTYHSDPFGLTKAGTTSILFESFDFRTSKGTIAWVRGEPGGGFSRPRRALELPFHASYPFLFETEQSVYCIPETSEGGEIALYRAVEFPHRWMKAATIVAGVGGMDNTIIEHDGRFWLFSTTLDDGPFSRLRIWYADDLFGPWKAHAANPVKTDARSSRPAGTPFYAGGELFRPAQDCSVTYGGSVVINRVVDLTTAAFREEPVATVSPFWDLPYVHGIHTLSALGDRTLVDGKCIAFNRSEMGRQLREALEVRWPQVLSRH